MSSTFAALILGFLSACIIGISATNSEYENYENKITQLEKNNKVLNERLIDCSN